MTSTEENDQKGFTKQHNKLELMVQFCWVGYRNVLFEHFTTYPEE